MRTLFIITAVGISLISNTYADDSEECQTSFHLSDADKCDDDEGNCGEHRPWYFNYHHHAFDEDLEDPTDELDYDTAWPSERVEYSDQLFR